MWRVLLLEDDENDATIIRHELRDLANLSTVRDRASYESELTLFTNDVILADFSVPGFVDYEAILELLTQLFQVQNTVITAVTKIKDALEVVNKYFFHLALIDLQMPDGSGVEIVRKIKEVSRNCMVIITSGFPDMLTKAQGLGYIGVLMKPFSVSVAHEILRKHRLNYND